MTRVRIEQTGPRKPGLANYLYWSEAYVNELIADDVAGTNVLLNVRARTGRAAKLRDLERSLPRDLPQAIGPESAPIQGIARLEGGYFGADGLWAWRGTSATDIGRAGWCLLGPAYNAGPDITYVVDLMADSDGIHRPMPVALDSIAASRLQRLLAVEHPAARTAAITALGRDGLASELRDAVDTYPFDDIPDAAPVHFAAAIYAQHPGGSFAGENVEAVYIGAPIWVYRHFFKASKTNR